MNRAELFFERHHRSRLHASISVLRGASRRRVGPQLFQERFAGNGYKTPFAICAGMVGAACVTNAWTWWLTRNVEWDVRRVRRLRMREEKRGRIYAGEDVHVYEEREFYSGLRRGV